MLEIKTPLGDAKFESANVTLREAAEFKLTLYAGSAGTLRRESIVVPEFGFAKREAKNIFFRVGPEQVLILGPDPQTSLCFVTPLSSARCRIEVAGPKARELLSACAAVDFSPSAFGTDSVAMTAIHHTPVMIHALPNEAFHIYGLRSFAVNLWDWLLDVAQNLR